MGHVSVTLAARAEFSSTPAAPGSWKNGVCMVVRFTEKEVDQLASFLQGTDKEMRLSTRWEGYAAPVESVLKHYPTMVASGDGLTLNKMCVDAKTNLSLVSFKGKDINSDKTWSTPGILSDPFKHPTPEKYKIEDTRGVLFMLSWRYEQANT